MKFDLGSIVATPGVLNLLSQHARSPDEFLVRHANGDWGELDASDASLQRAIIEGRAEGRLMSVYTMLDHTRIWIITEHDRSVTTILLPEEY